LTAISRPATGSYNGLRKAEPTLPAADYHDPARYRAEMDAIWSRTWINVCRSSDVAGPRCFRTVRVAGAEIVLLRDENGLLRGFHNTCRHRGSALCTEAEGRLKGRLLVCPYHSWSYATDGRLVGVPSKSLPDGFDKTQHGLYGVAVEEWRGFVFLNLDQDTGTTAATTFDPGSASLDNWPLEQLVVGHRYVKRMQCNWKIFWENFNECLHCPNVHPELSALVPIYGRGLMAPHDDPHWERHADDASPEYSGGLRSDAQTWSIDGKAHGPVFAGLTQAEREAGQTYVTHLPSMFVVGHVDYVRSVRLLPLGPEETEMTAEWLFPAEPLASGEIDVDGIVAFGRLVLDQDAAICETNQRGLRSRRHQAGVLMPEEYDVHRFQDWVRNAMAATGVPEH
jgi:Rieske 2Fe-2S family protein